MSQRYDCAQLCKLQKFFLQIGLHFMNLRKKSLVLHLLFGFIDYRLDFIGVVTFETDQVLAKQVFH